jgi:signal transduction histidine kinase
MTRGPVDLVRVIETSLNIASNEIRHRAQLVKDFAPIRPVQGNAAQLGQVVLNLVLNAVQAIPEGSPSTHEIRVVTRPGPDDSVTLEVHDTGSGIPESARARVFDPFFTTKPIGVGTGLGLSICHSIVGRHGGEITIDNGAGRGCVVRVRLPG